MGGWEGESESCVGIVCGGNGLGWDSTCSPPRSAGSFFTGGRAVAKRPIAVARSDFVSVMSWSPSASSESRVFISSPAHCIKLSVRRPLYFERSTASVPLSMMPGIAVCASGASLYPFAFSLMFVIVTSSGTV